MIFSLFHSFATFRIHQSQTKFSSPSITLPFQTILVLCVIPSPLLSIAFCYQSLSSSVKLNSFFIHNATFIEIPLAMDCAQKLGSMSLQIRLRETIGCRCRLDFGMSFSADVFYEIVGPRTTSRMAKGFSEQ
jgi:hypothetical protein